MTRRLRVVLAALVVAACRAATPPREQPAILLVVLDTVRADAVSAYGATSNTTPFFDSLARDSVLYRNAFSNAPWTLPSHATLFSGKLPREHGVGFRTWRAPDHFPTIAASLASAGYRTGGYSENPLVGPLTHLDQGFSHFETLLPRDAHGDAIVAMVQRWLDGGDEKPFFLFVNISDAHSPYDVRAENRFLPAGVDAALAQAVYQDTIPAPLCHQPRDARDIDILRGLYLGDVASADRKLAAVYDAARRAAGRRELITIVTADHGESFGEQRLMGHLFSVGNQLLKVPLLVHREREKHAAVIPQMVELAQVAPSILSWAHVDGARSGATLPSRPAAAGARAVVAQYQDPARLESSGVTPLFRLIAERANSLRTGCRAADGVFGEMEAVISPPYKMVSADDGRSLLFDLQSDPREEHDISREHRAVLSRMMPMTGVAAP